MARNRQNALALLLNYDSDSDRDSGYTSEEEKKRKNTFLFNVRERKAKRSRIDNESQSTNETMPKKVNENTYFIEDSNSTNRERLIPLPEEFQNVCDHVDDPVQHEGRVRSFPHERGNWASIIFIPITFGIFNPQINSLVASMITSSKEQNIELFQCTDYHVSLSLTFILRLEWIHPLIEDLRCRLSKCKKFSMWLHGLDVFCNEERTRTFLAIKVGHGKNEMKEISEIASESLNKYNIFATFNEYSFHVSVAWCHGDKREEVKCVLPLLQGICDQYFYMESDMRTFDVEGVSVKTGNRIHQIVLSSS
ncbi:UNVERIFIED_CONTAM: hypothetical protein RMT77_005595 [Armadillidium vulgare]|nr:U6 snRNA phosphodiesterase [Armadillidium vulgare]